jgi:hypothetical protein
MLARFFLRETELRETEHSSGTGPLARFGRLLRSVAVSVQAVTG